jgi:hypothetical protein
MNTTDPTWGRAGAESAYALLRDAVLVAAALPTTLAAYQLHHLLGTTPALVHWATGAVAPLLVAAVRASRLWWDGVIVHAVLIGSVLGAVLAAVL